MKSISLSCVLALAAGSSALFAQPQSATADLVAGIQRLQATEVARHAAAEASQGAAADADHFYAITNFRIGKYDKRTGDVVARFTGERDGLVRHMNSCFAEQHKLLCANSNFPEVPMGSSIEVFDSNTLEHLTSYSLGMLDDGSLTWFDRLGDGWIAGFAHYSETGGLPYKDQSYSAVVRYDSDWRRTGGWMLPESVIARLDPMAASGGALGPDGLLYLTGHDHKEMYVLAAPAMGPRLIHLATINVDLEGQAFTWDRSVAERVVYGISRPNREVRAFQLPEVAVPAGVHLLTSDAVLRGLQGL